MALDQVLLGEICFTHCCTRRNCYTKYCMWCHLLFGITQCYNHVLYIIYGLCNARCTMLCDIKPFVHSLYAMECSSMSCIPQCPKILECTPLKTFSYMKSQYLASIATTLCQVRHMPMAHSTHISIISHLPT